MEFTRHIIFDKPTPARMATLIGGVFGQVSRAMAGGSSGPEAFTLLLRLLMTHPDRVDTEEGYTKLHTSDCVMARNFTIIVGRVGYVCRPIRGVSVFRLRE